MTEKPFLTRPITDEVKNLAIKLVKCGEESNETFKTFVAALALLMSYYIGVDAEDPDKTIDELAAYLKFTIHDSSKNRWFDS